MECLHRNDIHENEDEDEDDEDVHEFCDHDAHGLHHQSIHEQILTRDDEKHKRAEADSLDLFVEFQLHRTVQR